MVVTYAIVIYYKLMRQHAVGLDLSMLLGWIHQLGHSGPKYLALGLLDLLAAAGCPAESEYKAGSSLTTKQHTEILFILDTETYMHY